MSRHGNSYQPLVREQYRLAIPAFGVDLGVLADQTILVLRQRLGIQRAGTERSFQASLQTLKSDVAHGRGIGREGEHGSRHL